jgi:hypothetical protein
MEEAKDLPVGHDSLCNFQMSTTILRDETFLVITS